MLLQGWHRNNYATKLILFVMSTMLPLLYATAPLFVLQQNYFPFHYMYDMQRGAQIILFALTTLSLGNGVLRQAYWQTLYAISPLTRIFLFAWLSLGAVAACLARKPVMAFIELSHFALLCHLIVYLASLRNTARALFFQQAEGMRSEPSGHFHQSIDANLLTMLLVVSLIYAAFCLLIDVGQITDFNTGSSGGIGYPGFNNIRFFSQYQVWFLPLMSLSLLVYRQKSLLFRLTALMVTIVWWSFMVLGASRGLFLSLIFGTVSCLILFRRQVLGYLLVLVLCYSGGVVFSHYVNRMNDLSASEERQPGAFYVFERLQKQKEVFRPYMWKSILYASKAHILFGVGPMHLADSHIEHIIVASVHNALIKFYAEWGLLACFALLCLLWRASKSWWRVARPQCLKNPETQLLCYALTCAVSAALFYAMFSAVVETPMSQLGGCFLLGWMLSLTQQYNRDQTPTCKLTKVKVALPSLLLMCILSFYLVLTLPRLYYAPQITAYYLGAQQREGGIDGLHPQFWVQGRLS